MIPWKIANILRPEHSVIARSIESYCVISRPPIQFEISAKLIEGNEDSVEVQRCIPPVEQWSVREDHSNT